MDELESQQREILYVLKELEHFPRIPPSVNENLRYAMLNVNDDNFEVVNEMIKTVKELMEVWKRH